MNCSRELIEAYLDEELAASDHAAVEEHLAGCSNCSEVYARLREQKAEVKAAAPYYTAPPELRRSVREALGRVETERAGTAPQPPWRIVAIAASVLLVLSAGWNVLQTRRRPPDSMAEIVLTGHIRSLISGNPVDVESSDQHTVKPWFAGKLDFAPQVKDLAAQGFPLAGGRVDYLVDRRVAALVYHRRKHVITLFTWPGAANAAAASRRGYNLVEWSDGAMTYWAVSDVAAGELETFRSLYQEAR